MARPRQAPRRIAWAAFYALVGVGLLIYLAITYRVAVAGDRLTGFDYAAYGLAVVCFVAAIYVYLRR